MRKEGKELCNSADFEAVSRPKVGVWPTRALWWATGMKKEDFQKPIIAIANSFTQFVPGHVHLHEIGQRSAT